MKRCKAKNNQLSFVSRWNLVHAAGCTLDNCSARWPFRNADLVKECLESLNTESKNAFVKVPRSMRHIFKTSVLRGKL